MKEIGFAVAVEPEGAFCVLANAKSFNPNSRQLASDILNNARVAIAPGIDFGSNAEGYLRFSYTNSLKNIKEGINRLQDYIKTKKHPAFSRQRSLRPARAALLRISYR